MYKFPVKPAHYGACFVALGIVLFFLHLYLPRLDGFDATLHHTLLWQLRLPRVVVDIAVGALLGLSGALAQKLFNNPLAEPYLLGSAAGALCGVALYQFFYLTMGIYLLNAAISMSVYAFGGALVALGLALLVARGNAGTTLILAGVMVSMLCSAFTTFLYVLHPPLLNTLQNYALGNTVFVSLDKGLAMLLCLGVSFILALLHARSVDILLLGEAVAQSMGLPLRRLQYTLILLFSLCTALAVANVGLLAFVGLLAPHIARLLKASNTKQLIALSTLIGADLISAADLAAKLALYPRELPLGVLTAFLGALYMLILLMRHTRHTPIK